MENMETSRPFQESISSEALYESMWKCRRGKLWKASVARYVLHGIDETLKLEEELNSGKYQPRKPHEFTLYYPKVRPCSSTHIRDRIVQRSLNDNVIYPEMTRGFIWDNMACQKGKGTDKAMDRLNCFMRRAWMQNGRSVEGLYMLQADIQGYYRNMRHDDATACFARKLDSVTVEHAVKWLQRQYPGELGYAPGSQMVQILGISMLDPLDHFIKERLRAKIYERYMDDFYIISDDLDYLKRCRYEISMELARRWNMRLHPKKTRIYPLKDGIRVLGFTFRIDGKGKVYRILKPENVKHERKKLLRLARKVERGETTVEKARECYQSWKAHAEKGNSKKLLRRMDAYFDRLFADIQSLSQN